MLYYNGYDVTICSRGKKDEFLVEIPADLTYLQADKSDAQAMEKILQEPYEVIIDSVPSEETITIIQQKASKLRHYVHCSSTGGYAPLARIPGDETLPYTNFRGGWQKKSRVDSMALTLFAQGLLPATIIRPSYITGTGKLPLDNLGGRRPDFLTDIKKGNKLDLPNDGQALLQPIHVKDLAQAFLLAIETRESIGQIYNICLEKAITLQRYLELNAEALGAPAVNISYLPLEEMVAKYEGQSSETGLRFLATHMCYDISKAKTHLGYRPQYTTEEAVMEGAQEGWELLQTKAE
jgi:nucleoside-diphosphate-sugar epimerase